MSFGSETNDKFIIHKPEGDKRFSRTKHGLYRFDTRDTKNYTFLDTMDAVKSRYTRRQIEDAKRARDLHAMVA